MYLVYILFFPLLLIWKCLYLDNGNCSLWYPNYICTKKTTILVIKFNIFLVVFMFPMWYILIDLSPTKMFQVRVQSDPAGRLVISGQPEQLDNPWGVTPFKKVWIEIPFPSVDFHPQLLAYMNLYWFWYFERIVVIYSSQGNSAKLKIEFQVVSLPSRIDPHQTSAVVTLHGQLFVRVPFEQADV